MNIFKKLFHTCLPTDMEYIVTNEDNSIILAQCQVCNRCYMYVTKNGVTNEMRISLESYEHAKKKYKGVEV